MKTWHFAGAFLLALAACSTQSRTVSVTPRGDTIISPSGRPLAQVAGTLRQGTKIEAVLQEEVSSANKKPGDDVRATLTNEVKDINGQVLFPAGTEAQMRITQLRAPADDQDNGEVGFSVMSLKKDGRTYDVTSSADPSSYQVKNRGALDDPAKVAIGAGAGAVVGGLISGSVKGVVLGGLLGGAAGAVYNSQTSKRDVVVKSGTKLQFELDQPVVVMVS